MPEYITSLYKTLSKSLSSQPKLKPYIFSSLGVFIFSTVLCPMDMSLNELREMVMDREALRAAIHGVTKTTELN